MRGIRVKLTEMELIMLTLALNSFSKKSERAREICQSVKNKVIAKVRINERRKDYAKI